MPLEARVVAGVRSDASDWLLIESQGSSVQRVPLYRDNNGMKLYYLDGDTNKEKSMTLRAKRDGLYRVYPGKLSRNKKLEGKELQELVALLSSQHLALTGSNGLMHRIPAASIADGYAVATPNGKQQRVVRVPGKGLCVKVASDAFDVPFYESILARRYQAMMLEAVQPKRMIQIELPAMSPIQLPAYQSYDSRLGREVFRIPYIENADKEVSKRSNHEVALFLDENSQWRMLGKNGDNWPLTLGQLDHLQQKLAATYTRLLCQPDEKKEQKKNGEFFAPAGGGVEGPLQFIYQDEVLPMMRIEHDSVGSLVVKATSSILQYPETVSELCAQIDKMKALEKKLGKGIGDGLVAFAYSPSDTENPGYDFYLEDSQRGEFVLRPAAPVVPASGEASNGVLLRMKLSSDPGRYEEVSCEWDNKKKQLMVDGQALPKNLAAYVEQYIALKQQFGERAKFAPLAREQEQALVANDFYVTPTDGGKVVVHERLDDGAMKRTSSKNAKLLADDGQLMRLIASIESGGVSQSHPHPERLIRLQDVAVNLDLVKKQALIGGLDTAKDNLFSQIKTRLEDRRLGSQEAGVLRQAFAARQLCGAKGDYAYKNLEDAYRDVQKYDKANKKNLLRVLYLCEALPDTERDRKEELIRLAASCFYHCRGAVKDEVRRELLNHLISPRVHDEVFHDFFLDNEISTDTYEFDQVEMVEKDEEHWASIGFAEDVHYSNIADDELPVVRISVGSGSRLFGGGGQRERDVDECDDAPKRRPNSPRGS